jgi:DNA-binding NarL/FixJ family response regulator
LELSGGIPSAKEQDRPFLLEELTPRERDVLSLLSEGLTNKAIAQHLGISEYTVKFHVNTIFRKLGAQSRTEAAVRAARLGLITL